MAANPWLAGRLVKRGKDLYLDYPSINGEEHMLHSWLTEVDSEGVASVDTDMDYACVCSGIAKSRSEIGNGGALIGKD